jgi:hypothetical protein
MGPFMKIGAIGTIVATLAWALALGGPASAQSSRWADPYQKGLKAFESGKYAEAVAQLERAVAADPKAEPKKVIEGVFRLDYFPYYYLALAYVELRQFDKAQQNLEKARPTLSRPQQAKITDAESKIKIALGPKPPQRNAEFDSGARNADALLSGRQFDAAIKELDRLRAMDAAEYGKAGLAARRDEAVKGLAGQLADEARTLIQGARFRDALAKLQHADQLLPAQKPVTDMLAEIKKRENDYQRLKTEGQAAFASKNYTVARDTFEQARTAHPEQFASDNLVARLTEASTLASTSGRGGAGNANTGTINTIDPKVAEGQRLVDTAKQFITQRKYAEADAAFASALKADAKNQEAIDAVEKAKKFKALRDQGLQLSKSTNVAAARKVLVDARNLDAARFEREGLASVLDGLTRPTPTDTVSNAPEPSKLALQEGLLALLKGDAQKSIAILEPALSGGGDWAAPLHAYLGVAYATRALSAPKPEDQSRLREQAVEQFKLAASAQPGYRLSDRIVSPTIIKIYEQAQR